ncbi:DEAD/DEAH box helicase [Sinorhizobium meliloti]|uniref:DEAD/DEAH box helicase n=1 Tax=Rhizobium meliloti TaxID=382 RepID=UPI00299EE5E1|nr:DEAD/DEAH box helicase [Sinorhizobium meliloti]MDW9997803.1 DEAD/DEAH box helicase [Sinorhizobium meliloti]
MKPEATARRVLSTTRARAKMHEFRVAPEDFITLYRDPATLFNLAVGLLGDVGAAIADQFNALDAIEHYDPDVIPSSWNGFDLSVSDGLRFAATFFDAYLNAKLDETISVEFSLLCATAYYLNGSVGNAAVVVKNMESPPGDLAGGLGRLTYRILKNDFTQIDGSSPAVNAIVASLNGFMTFKSGVREVSTACDNLRKTAYWFGSPREFLYADLITAACATKLRNASRTMLPAASGLPSEAWRPALAKPHFPIELWPAQQKIAEGGLLAGRSAVIQMPTSAGKTRATELIIRSAFMSKRASLAVIVAPYRSLCHDIRSDLVAAFAGEPIKLDEASDSFQFDIQLEEILAANTVLIVTPEKLLYMLRRAPDLVERIGLVIYDEGHQFDGLTRGPTYELLLTSLKLTLPTATQVVLISAVIGNARDVAEWLVGDREAVIDGAGLLPTSKSVAFASWQDARGRLAYVSPTDPDDTEFYVPRLIDDVELKLRGREKKVQRFPTKSDGGEVGLFLGLHVVDNGSVAVFCGRKDSATKICRRAVDIFERGAEFLRPIDVSDAAEVGRIRYLAELHLGPQATATKAAAIGVFAHHADTPQGLRLSIEHAMKEGLAKFVVCTSTLAQGVNFPLKYLIVTSTRQGKDRMMVRDFQNLMGRAGRAGMHTEGSIIFSTPSVFDQKSEFRQRWRWDEAKELLDSRGSEPTNSSILALFDSYEQRQQGAPPVVQPVLAQWLDLAFADQARIEAVVNEAIALQPNISSAEFTKFIERRARAIQAIAAFLIANMTFLEEDGLDRVAELAAQTLAHHLAGPEIKDAVIAVFQMIAAAIAANTDGDQRAVIRKSPLPPAIVAELQVWLTANADALRAAIEADQLLDFAADRIIAWNSSPSIRSLSTTDFLRDALADWVSGRPFHDIHRRMISVDVRVSGDRATIEDAVALCESAFAYDLAMVAASLSDLAEGMDETLYAGFSKLQKQIKYGLTDLAAMAFIEAGFADRVVANSLSVLWNNVRDREGVRAACRHAALVPALSVFPSYFSTVAAELAG